MPALEEAAEALQNLKKDDIAEIRSFAKPQIQNKNQKTIRTLTKKGKN